MTGSRGTRPVAGSATRREPRAPGAVAADPGATRPTPARIHSGASILYTRTDAVNRDPAPIRSGQVVVLPAPEGAD